MTIIDCISDLHGHLPKLEGGDLLIVAGDLTARGEAPEYIHFCSWLKTQNYRKKVVIAGNHDSALETDGHLSVALFQNIADYLLDSSTEFEGLKIWGAPWTPPFLNWHFMLGPEEIKKKWALIPDDIDLLVTHGPPYGILDKNDHGDCCGSVDLLERVKKLKPKLHVFGHIHEGGGIQFREGNSLFVNASIMDQHYIPVNKPVRVIL